MCGHKVKGSCDHTELGASELTLEQPVTQIDGEVNLIRPLDLIEMLVLVNIDGHELVANLRSMLGCVDKAELLCVNGLC